MVLSPFLFEFLICGYCRSLKIAGDYFRKAIDFAEKNVYNGVGIFLSSSLSGWGLGENEKKPLWF